MVMKFGYPFDSILNIQRALEDSMTSDWFGPSTSSRGGFPPINVFTEDDNYVVIAELPGVSRDAINVEIHRKQVRLSGKKEISYGEKVSIHRREREAGNFDRTITLPFKVDVDNVKAEHRDGILALHLSRAEQDKPRSIAIG